MSLIIEKYKYEKLQRVEVGGKRRYAAPGGPPVASVTTILSGTKDMSHLIAWKKRVGEKKAQEVVTEAKAEPVKAQVGREETELNYVIMAFIVGVVALAISDSIRA